MPDTRLHVLCIGNAIVDVIANSTDDFLSAEGLVKGSMRLIDADEAERLYARMGPAHQVSGGSAGNTAAGIAALGGRAGFIGQAAPHLPANLLDQEQIRASAILYLEGYLWDPATPRDAMVRAIELAREADRK